MIKDLYAYHIISNSGIDIDDDTYSYKQHLKDLREYIEHGGRLIELQSESTFDFPKWLTDENIPHHFEWIPVKNGDHVMDVLFVIHVYEADHAFGIRLRTNWKPMRLGWRERWLAEGFDSSRYNRLR
jgi:hypothetical protein